MQRRVHRECIRGDLEQSLAHVCDGHDIWCSQRVPLWTREQSLTPGCKSRLACVDLLTTTNQCDDHRPIGMSVQDVQEQRRLALRVTEFATTEVRVPCSLC